MATPSSNQVTYVHHVNTIHGPPNITSSSKTLHCDRILSTPKIHLNIFLFLSASCLLQNTPLVNRNWRKWTNEEENWKVKLPQNIISNFTPLVMRRYISWKEVHRYARLSFLIENVIANRYSQQDFIMLKNTQLNIMPRPGVQYGEFRFAISNLIDIEVSEEINPEPFVLKDRTGRELTHFAVEADDLFDLKQIGEGVVRWDYERRIVEERNLKVFYLPGEKGEMLSHLAVEGNNLFALRRDGIIVQWNYKTRAKIREIRTTYSDESEEFRQSKRQISGLFCQDFYIRNGIIIIAYVAKGIDLTRPLEIISYENPTEKHFIQNFPLRDLKCIEVLEDNRIIILGRDSLGNTSIWKTEFPTKAETYTPSAHHHLIWTPRAQKSLESTTTKTPITSPSPYPWPTPEEVQLGCFLQPVSIEKIDPPKKAYRTCNPRHMFIDACTTIGNLVFIFSSVVSARIDLIRINSEDEGKLDRLEMSPLPLNFDTSEWRINLLAYLILKAKKELGETTTSQSSTSTHNPGSNAQT